MNECSTLEETSAARGDGRAAGPLSVPWLWLIFSAEMLLAWAVRVPETMRFAWVAFEDLGGTLTIQHALDQGLRPTVDFYYPYGLLPLLLGRGWFGVLGQTPWAYQAAQLACNLLVTWGLARFAKAVNAGVGPLTLMVVLMPLLARPSYLNLTHAVESALLCHAVAEHARGRRASALALLSVCVFVKPTMAYVYGLCLLALVIRDLAARRPCAAKDWVRALAPSVAVVASLSALLAAVYGLPALLAVQIPLRGGSSYKYVNYGFFRGVGRNFWNPPGANLGYYFGTHAGFWLLATLVLLCGGVWAGWRLGRGADGGGADRPRLEVAVCALAMHLAFVCAFYGAPWDWQFYVYVLVTGVVALAPRGGWADATAAVLVPVALLGYTSDAREVAQWWKERAPSPATAGLWATPGERAEWDRVLELTEGSRPAIIKLSGCAELLFPRFVGTDSFYVHPKLIGPLMPPAEKARIVALLRRAPMLVVVSREGEGSVLDDPDFRRAADGCRLVWKGEFCAVYRREREPGA